MASAVAAEFHINERVKRGREVEIRAGATARVFPEHYLRAIIDQRCL